MLAHSLFFYTFAFIAIFSAIMVTASKNTVHSVFFLILDFISVSCLFIMIGAEFLGMIMLIVYVGAVAVLFLFVGMLVFMFMPNNTNYINEWWRFAILGVGLGIITGTGLSSSNLRSRVSQLSDFNWPSKETTNITRKKIIKD